MGRVQLSAGRPGAGALTMKQATGLVSVRAARDSHRRPTVGGRTDRKARWFIVKSGDGGFRDRQRAVGGFAVPSRANLLHRNLEEQFAESLWHLSLGVVTGRQFVVQPALTSGTCCERVEHGLCRIARLHARDV